VGRIVRGICGQPDPSQAGGRQAAQKGGLRGRSCYIRQAVRTTSRAEGACGGLLAAFGRRTPPAGRCYRCFSISWSTSPWLFTGSFAAMSSVTVGLPDIRLANLAAAPEVSSSTR